VKNYENGLLFLTRRGKRGQAPRLVCEPCVIVGEFADALVVIPSRPIYAGAPRRQYVPRRSVLNLSRLGMGSPAAPQTVANAAA
jgi:hypothetical protein